MSALDDASRGYRRYAQIKMGIADGRIPASDWKARIRDDIWKGKARPCHWCGKPLHIVRGLHARAIAAMCSRCDQGEL